MLAAVVLALSVGAHYAFRPAAPRLVQRPLQTDALTPDARGRQVYLRYGCSTCHGPNGEGGVLNPNAESEGKIPAVKFVAEAYTRAELRKQVLKGTATIGKADARGPRPPFRMPGWAGQMSDAEADDLVAYLISLYPKSENSSWR